MKKYNYFREDVAFRCVHVLSRLYMGVMFDKVVRHKDRIPEGPKIYATNHPSTLDPLFIAGIIKEPVHTLLIESVFRVFFLKTLVKMAGQISVGQGPKRKQALYRSCSLLNKNRSILIFPEGTESFENRYMLKIHTGAVRMALKTGKPIIPLGVYLDPRKIKHRRMYINHQNEIIDWYQHGPYVVTFGNPLYLKGRESDRLLVSKQTVMLGKKIENLRTQSKIYYLAKQAYWKQRKEVLEKKLSLITRLKLFPTYSPHFIRPLVAILTIWKRVMELLEQKLPL